MPYHAPWKQTADIHVSSSIEEDINYCLYLYKQYYILSSSIPGRRIKKDKIDIKSVYSIHIQNDRMNWSTEDVQGNTN